MKILLLGDIVGRSGRRAVCNYISGKNYDLVIANGENSAGGFGITPSIVEQLNSAGIHIITSGNHIWKRKEIIPFLETDQKLLIRPANYPSENPGKGFVEYKLKGLTFLVINLQGRIFMPECDCPFHCVDQILESRKADTVIVDFHAEATSEKVAMGKYLDGRVAVVFGTHTHVQTSDARILPGGTIYHTDLGMCGPGGGVIGVKFEDAIFRFIHCRPGRMTTATGASMINGLEVCLNEEGKPVSYRIIRYKESPSEVPETESFDD